MESRSKQTSQTSLFQVYLRLRPPLQVPTLRSQQTEPWLIVEPSSPSATTNGTSFEEAARILKPTHITLQPPNDSRKRAVEKFGFTKVFQQDSSQIDLFEQTGTVDIVSNVLNRGRDGLVATLGVTGSGKVEIDIQTKSYANLVSTEPYDPWFSVRTRNHSDDLRCYLSIPWLPHTPS